MATEHASSVSTEPESLAKWTSWLAALVGLWVLVSPFVLTGSIASGTAMWSNVVAGLVVAVFAAYGAYEHRMTATSTATAEWSGWLAAIAGLWMIASPFVLTGAIASGTPMYSNVIAGVAAAIFAGFAGYAMG